MTSLPGRMGKVNRGRAVRGCALAVVLVAAPVLAACSDSSSGPAIPAIPAETTSEQTPTAGENSAPPTDAADPGDSADVATDQTDSTDQTDTGGQTGATDETGPAGADSSAEASAGSGMTPVALTPHDPPLKFADTPSAEVNRAAFESNMGGTITSNYSTLRGSFDYVATPAGLEGYDLAKNVKAWTAPFENNAQQANSSGMVNTQGPLAPTMSADGATVAAAYVQLNKGSGTTKDTTTLVGIGVDAKTGKQKWKVSAPIKGDDASSAGDARTRVVGFDGDTAVVTYSGDASYGAAISLADNKVLWDVTREVGCELQCDADNSLPVIAAEGVFVVGSQLPHDPTDNVTPITYTLDGYSMKTGKRVWRQPDASAEQDDKKKWSYSDTKADWLVGANRLAVMTHTEVDPPGAEEYSNMRGALQIRQLSDGKLVDTILGIPVSMGGSGDTIRCAGDQGKLAACWDGVSSDWVFAFDPQTGKELWELPDEKAGRESLTVGPLFQGMLYGKSSNGPVILDLRTGKDKVTDPGPGSNQVAAVSEFGAMALGDNGAEFFPATG